MIIRLAVLAAALSAFAPAALAHPGHESGAGALVAGLAHPLQGIDHVLAMTAVGIWAAHLSGRALWMLPTAFVASMLGGFALALAGLNLPVVEPGIAASVLVLGILLATSIRLPLAPSALIAGVFALLHGHAHGAVTAGGMFAFSVGFAAATIVLHAAGLALGRSLIGQGRLALARGLGVSIAGVGLVLLGGLA